MNRWIIVLVALFAAPALGQSAQTTAPSSGEPTGQVNLTLEEYRRLLEQANAIPEPPPSAYAVGQSHLLIDFSEKDRRVTGRIEAQIDVETFEDGWTLVPLLGPGAALDSATLNGRPVRLIQRADGLYWLSQTSGISRIRLIYHVDARHDEASVIASIPVPEAAATGFEMRVPGSHVDLNVAPASNLRSDSGSGVTMATGTLPATPSVLVSWRMIDAEPVILSRARYTGQARGEAIGWTVRYTAEVLSEGEHRVPLVSTAITLVDARVDGEPATILEQDGRFAVRLSGAGVHRIELSLLSPIDYPDGVPSTGFEIPQVPVSQFELDLPGQKDLKVFPAASVETRTNAESGTRATFFTRLSDRVTLSWMEAIPDEVSVELRASAGVYQALRAAEGVLYGEASVSYEITRGEANALRFTLPATAQVNRITSPSAAIADWVTEVREDGQTVVQVFLNRAVSGEFVLEVSYEQLLAPQADAIAVPLLRAQDVSRQRGMLALLAGSELALAPETHAEMAEVGENQLPAFFRNRLEQVVLHTYKYHAPGASLAVRAVTPERKQGKFNAQVDTLISIGEVTLKGAASIEADVKSGVLRDLRLSLPADVNVLGVNGPSIRSHSITHDGQSQAVDIAFTQEMDGQFRIELNFERIMHDGVAETSVPRIEVRDADVEHGRIAIEALSALEVQALRTDQLSNLEINELPKQLVLKTTNPILLAYRYVRTDQPIDLALRITRHEEIEVQVAAIDTANYQTLFTRDGLAVTRARFDVRNSRRQFLRLSLPEGTDIWSVFVDGRAQKPAYASEEGAGPGDVLIKMINSATAFPVELVYATRGPGMKTFGTLTSRLPRPDMIVTRSQWDVYLPPGPRYKPPKSNMEISASGLLQAVRNAGAQLLYEGIADVVGGEPLRIELPTEGVRVQFSKLYANQSAEDAAFTLRYVRRDAHQWGLWLSLVAVAAIWAGIILLGRGPEPRLAYGLMVSGTLVAAVCFGLLETSVVPAASLALAVGAGYLVTLGFRAYRNRAAA